jgi:hypothetical protein
MDLVFAVFTFYSVFIITLLIHGAVKDVRAQELENHEGNKEIDPDNQSE